ncbi:DUF2884 domain-containing protein [Dyella caseinilytica]|uniref:DUF2884 domain-containing protein n=1 Tax=Dyella caseinilytica TaxID=1849581 RepID=A0ABX7GZN1_9GAMM|nr:DUF2884 domain-containing protein [Dyella caseinilytica]QRN55107.1 DUF2884 domain-containing protein [Dyella caseinilytica]GFZ99420.1 hypothetical protein GCM10011408_20140 [Dyella caseinilytica]
MNYANVLGTLALCSLLTACGHGSSDYSIVNIGPGIHLSHGGIHAGDGQIRVYVSNAPDAVISANGDLQINQQAVAVDPAVRELLKTYYQNAMMVRTDGIATGKAGAAIGEQVAKSVTQALSSGHPEQIGQDVEAKAQLVKQSALKICQDLGAIQTAQDQLAAKLPAFQPYSHLVTNHDISDCKDDTVAN